MEVETVNAADDPANHGLATVRGRTCLEMLFKRPGFFDGLTNIRPSMYVDMAHSNGIEKLWSDS